MTKLETKVEKLAREMRKTKQELKTLRELVTTYRPMPSPPPVNPGAPKRAVLDTVLRQAGLLVYQTELEGEIFQHWRKLSLAERKQIRAELRGIKLDVLASDIIIENRR